MKYELKETMLCFDNVTLGYDGKEVLKNINLIEKNVVRPNKTTGQVIAIIGRSGRGKSTLFKALTGLLKPLDGRVMISDSNNNAKIVEPGDVGFVDQKYTLFRHKTVEQILKFSLRKSNLNEQEKKETIEKHLTDWNLINERAKYSVELSGGQRQRVCIVEKILSSSRFMVLDEPTSGLDLINIDKIKESFELIQSTDELNTLIFSTHDINFAVEMADSIYIVGYPEGVKDYSTIVKHFDLKEMGLAWTEFGQKHIDLVNDIKEIFRKS
jgi:ABC-type nitrate/sulfonate/bicarbonate transport system ATPase subunit